MQDKAGFNEDFGDSDNEGEPDAYLARVKAEAEERDSGSDGSDDESTDDDFNPDAEKVEDVADEYDRYGVNMNTDCWITFLRFLFITQRLLTFCVCTITVISKQPIRRVTQMTVEHARKRKRRRKRRRSTRKRKPVHR